MVRLEILDPLGSPDLQEQLEFQVQQETQVKLEALGQQGQRARPVALDTLVQSVPRDIQEQQVQLDRLGPPAQ